MSSQNYVQPLACHRQFAERLLVRNGAGHHLVWFGDGRELVEIPAALAQWIISCPEMYRMQAPLLWFDPSSLPLAATAV